MTDNPKDAIGSRKVPMSVVPTPVIMEVAVGMLEGSLRYGSHNYRKSGVRASVYYDAVNRHLGAWWEGEDIDPDSGLSHVVKAISSLVVLRDAMIRGKMIDNRPPGTSGFVTELNKKCEELIAKYTNPADPFLADGKPDKYMENKDAGPVAIY